MVECGNLSAKTSVQHHQRLEILRALAQHAVHNDAVGIVPTGLPQGARDSRNRPEVLAVKTEEHLEFDHVLVLARIDQRHVWNGAVHHVNRRPRDTCGPKAVDQIAEFVLVSRNRAKAAELTHLVGAERDSSIIEVCPRTPCIEMICQYRQRRRRLHLVYNN